MLWAAGEPRRSHSPVHGPGSGRSVLRQLCGPSRSYSDHTLWTAFLGLHDQSKRSATGVQELGLKRIIAHPFFNDFTFDYDIALLELDKPADYSSSVRPICLPESSHSFPAGKAIWVTGWGHTQEGGERARGLAGGGSGGRGWRPLGRPPFSLPGGAGLFRSEVQAGLRVEGLAMPLNLSE